MEIMLDIKLNWEQMFASIEKINTWNAYLLVGFVVPFSFTEISFGRGNNGSQRMII